MGGHIDRQKDDIEVLDHVMGGVRPGVRGQSDEPAEKDADRRRQPERDREGQERERER